MPPIRILIAICIGLAMGAPLCAEAGTGLPAPKAVSYEAAEIAVPKRPKAQTGTRHYPEILAVNWSLASDTSPQISLAGSAVQTADLEDPETAQDPENTKEAEGPLDEPVDGDNPASEIIVDGSYGPPDTDPAEALNYESYRITQAVDDAFVEPVAYAYRDGLPGPFRDGLGNVVRNLGEPVNALNFLLQGKFGKAFGSLTRLLINSTLGLGGVFDMAEKPGIGIPYRRNGFANTLGFYGVEPGAYLYLPFTGATSVRDVIGSGLDQLVLPVAVGAPFNQLEYTVPYFIVNSLDARLEVDAELARIDAAVDPYAARRDTYLARREREIALLRGEEPPKPPLILLEIEGVIEPGDDYPEEMQDGEAGEGAPPLSLNIERGEVTAGQIR